MENDSNTYKIEAICTNCGHEGEVAVEKGVSVDQAPCPECDTASLKRKRKPINIGIAGQDY